MDEPTSHCFKIEWAVKKGDLVKITRYGWDGDEQVSYGLILKCFSENQPGQLALLPTALVTDFKKGTTELLGPSNLEIISAA